MLDGGVIETLYGTAGNTTAAFDLLNSVGVKVLVPSDGFNEDANKAADVGLAFDQWLATQSNVSLVKFDVQAATGVVIPQADGRGKALFCR